RGLLCSTFFPTRRSSDLTPQLQQSLRFLQLSAYELEQEVALAVQENPLLESASDDAVDTGDTVAEVGGDAEEHWAGPSDRVRTTDRKSTRLNSSHVKISY